MPPSIQDIRSRIKAFLRDDTLFMAALIVLVGAGSYGLGRASVSPGAGRELPAAVVTSQDRVPAAVAASTTADSEPNLNVTGSATYVGSKNGTKFHLPTCPGAAQIKEANKVYFSSKQEAYAKGYTEAANCAGI